MRNPPIMVSVLGFFGAIAGFAWIYLGLRILGFDYFGLLGDLPKYEQAGIWGWFALIWGIVWLVAAASLWALRPWAWTFVYVVAGIALLEAFLWFVEAPGSGTGLGMSIMPLLIIWYLHTPEVKDAFGKSAPGPER